MQKTTRRRPFRIRIPALLLLVSWSLMAGAPARSSGPAGGRPLLVTVDDLPLSAGSLHPDPAERERITRDMLAALARHGIRAVGLVTWRNVHDDRDLRLLENWLEAGHELGNHSRDHLSYTAVDSDTYIADVEAARARLAAFLETHGRKVRFFRFPMLREGDTPEKLAAMRDYLERSGQRNLHVTLDNQDWSFERPWTEAVRAGDGRAMARIADEYHDALRLAVRHHERTGDRLLERVTPQILLLHAGAVGAAQWDRLFTWLAETGHRFAGVEEVLADPAFADPPDYVGTHGPGYWDRMVAVRRQAAAEREIRDLLSAQSAAWSRGDLEAFCSVYADDALFISPSGLTRGREEVLARYRRRYPDGAAMGTLRLDIDEIRLARGTEVSMMGDAVPSRIHGATVAARWTLSYPSRDDATGRTLITLHPGPEGWRIVQDASF